MQRPSAIPPLARRDFAAARPFVKWAGGKGQLLGQLEAALPRTLSAEPFTYIEPFVGGGAMLFFMLRRFPNIRRAVINDINPVLAMAYRVVRDNPDSLLAALADLERDYLARTEQDARKEFYLARREEFNARRVDAVRQTALFVFLNHTCFNGLYRENAKGGFNVPFGRYANPLICNEPVIRADSALLNAVETEITTGNFEATAAAIRPGETAFFYFDPPYRPLSATSSFNSYVKEDFGDDAQRRLAGFCRSLSEKPGVFWMLSNSDCSAKNPADDFFETIYDGFTIRRVHASRMINSNPDKRGKLTEFAA